jgi:predicted ester cyclase
LRVEYPDLVIAGDHVAQTLVMEGTDTGGLLGQAPTGRPFRLFAVILLT